MSEMTRASLIIRYIVLLACTIYLFPRDEIQGIRIPDSTYLSRLSDAVRYRSLIKRTLAGNPAELEALVGFWCGGAGGCYEHGAVIVHIMYKMGDRDFYRNARQIDADSINGLEAYISAGFQYGGFVADLYIHDFGQDFPKTLSFIRNAHNRNQLTFAIDPDGFATRKEICATLQPRLFAGTRSKNM